MKGITEEQIFDLIDGKLSDEEKSLILRELPHFPEEEKLYRALLMTEGYIAAHAIDKPSPDFDDRLATRVQSIINLKKRTGILYRALSIFGLITISTMAGSIFMMTTNGAEEPLFNLQGVLSIADQVGGSLALLSGECFQILALLMVTFTFFVFADRILIKYFNFKHH